MFLYIFEDGSIKKGSDKPTPGDIVLVGEGILTIVQCENPKEIDNTATPIEIKNVQMEGGFHV